jgi:hypothetical protein
MTLRVKYFSKKARRAYRDAQQAAAVVAEQQQRIVQPMLDEQAWRAKGEPEICAEMERRLTRYEQTRGRWKVARGLRSELRDAS